MFRSSTPRKKLSPARTNPSPTKTHSSPVSSRKPLSLKFSSLSSPTPSPPSSSVSPPPPPPSPADSISSIQKKKNKSENPQKNADGVFKKPKGLPPKKKKAKISQSEEESRQDGPRLRRSSRVQKEIPKSLFRIMWEKSSIKSIENSEKIRIGNASKISTKRVSNANTDSDTVTIASSTCAITNPLINSAKKSARGKKKRIIEKRPNNILKEIPENGPLLIVEPTEIEHDQIVKNITTQKTNTTKKTRRVRVKQKRIGISNIVEQFKLIPKEIRSTVASSLPTESADYKKAKASKTNLVDWLKDLNCEPSTTCTNSSKSFVNMNLSTLDELSFKRFPDMDYAFYNTKEKCVGYMRFQPRQKKPASCITQGLHLLIISGEFNITTDGEDAYSKTGDLISINTGSIYSVESLSAEIGVILFMKIEKGISQNEKN